MLALPSNTLETNFYTTFKSKNKANFMLTA